MTLLHRRQPDRNMARFYAVSIERSLFGEFMLIRQWGRIGKRGQLRSDWFRNQVDAVAAGERIIQTKRCRGYGDVEYRGQGDAEPSAHARKGAGNQRVR
jgi:predicted DNA-binding WGR domain protein